MAMMAADKQKLVDERWVVQVCKVTCCGLMNFQQHCNSKKHLRKTATAGSAAIPEATSPGSGEDADSQALNPTYVGLQAQCRNYCKQVGRCVSC